MSDRIRTSCASCDRNNQVTYVGAGAPENLATEFKARQQAREHDRIHERPQRADANNNCGLNRSTTESETDRGRETHDRCHEGRNEHCADDDRNRVGCQPHDGDGHGKGEHKEKPDEPFSVLVGNEPFEYFDALLAIEALIVSEESRKLDERAVAATFVHDEMLRRLDG